VAIERGVTIVINTEAVLASGQRKEGKTSVLVHFDEGFSKHSRLSKAECGR